MRRALVIALIGIAAAVGVAAILARREAPRLRALDRTGRIVELKFSGHPRSLVHFWATWCKPCEPEIPLIVDYARRNEIPLHMITTERSVRDVDEFLKVKQLTIPVLFDGDGEAQRAAGVTAIPTTLLMNERGFVIERIVGAREWDGHASLPARVQLVQSRTHAVP